MMMLSLQRLTKFVRILIFTLIGSSISYGQLSSELKKYTEEYPNSHSVRIQQETLIKIALDKGNFVITEETTEEDLYLDESATYKSEQSISFSSFYEIEKIEASSFILKNGEYEEVKVTNFKEKDELDDFFYDDSKSLNFVYPNLSKGAKSKLNYIQKIKNPRFLNPFYFGNFFPVKNNKLTIIADKNIELDFKEINTENVEIQFSKEEGRKRTTYTWTTQSIDQYDPEEDSPDYKTILPHIIPMIKSYKVNGKQIKVLNDVSDLYGWYYSLVENINKEKNDTNLEALVQKLTQGKKDNLEKAKAIYYWTQENIKYIAFEYALGGFIPREANDVFKKKYGDCKDNSSILMKMLEIAGIQGNLTWIGTRSIPYKYEEVPTPVVDNHMILSFEHEGTTYFLDATGRYNSIDMPTSFIQGKEALVGFGKGSYKIKNVPIIEAQKSTLIDQTTVELEGDGLKGSSESEISGYLKIDYFYDLENKKTDAKIKAYYNARFQKGNNSFLIEKLSEENKFGYDKNLKVNYDFKVSNHANIIGNEIYVNLNLNREIGVFKIKKNRKTPVEHDFKKFQSYQTTFKIPEGYSVDYLPESVEVSNDYLKSSIGYKQEGNTIQYTHTISLDALLFDLEAKEKINELIDQIEQGYKEVVVLVKK